MKILENTIQNTRKCMYFLHYHTFHRGVLKNKKPTLLRAMLWVRGAAVDVQGLPLERQVAQGIHGDLALLRKYSYDVAHAPGVGADDAGNTMHRIHTCL